MLVSYKFFSFHPNCIIASDEKTKKEVEKMNVKIALKAILLLFLFLSASAITIALVNTRITPNYTKTASFASGFTVVTPTGGDIIDDPVAPG
jgi:hypothetical protein